MQSIAQLDRKATEAAQLRLDAEQGHALLNALASKWWEQGYNAALFGLDPNHQPFWTTDHQRGYLSAVSAPQFARRAVST